MPTEFNSYKHFRLRCSGCDTLSYVRTLPIYRPATLMLICPKCRNDICVAVAPDASLDGANQQNGYHAVALLDLIYLESGLTEEEGDRILWGNKHVLEQRIAEYRAAIGGEGLSLAENVINSTGP